MLMWFLRRSIRSSRVCNNRSIITTKKWPWKCRAWFIRKHNLSFKYVWSCKQTIFYNLSPNCMLSLYLPGWRDQNELCKFLIVLSSTLLPWQSLLDFVKVGSNDFQNDHDMFVICNLLKDINTKIVLPY